MRQALAPIAAALLAGSALVPAHAAEVFNRIATFPVVQNLPQGADPKKETVSEIISASEDGNLLVYTDSPREAVGFVDITDPARPKPAGFLAVGGEPTSVKVVGGKALVAVVTSTDKTKPAGELAVVDLASKQVESRCALGGQPDSIAAAPDKSFLAIAIENERDEDKDKGAIPQLPAGNLTIVPLKAGLPDCGAKRIVDLTGIAKVAPEDPEPEFVDVNGRGEIVVTIQENNHLAVVDGRSGKVVAEFPAGSTNLEKVDTKRDGVIAPTESKADVLREPDAVKWLDDDRFVTADEGDYKGGSRGFTIFGKDGKVLFESGAGLEHRIVRIGHYPEKRNAKGNEPEGIEVASFGGDRLIFVGSERSSTVAVYRDRGAGQAPEFLQILPGGVGPEGLLAIPQRGLFVTASETDLREDGGAGAMVTIYRRGEGAPAYPTLVSADGADGAPIPWGAISGTAADAATAGKLYAVTDSVYAQARILTIDTTKTPAVITAATTVTQGGQPAKNLDLEGIALRPEGGFWLASEGNPERKENPTHSQLVRVDEKGAIQEVVDLPEQLRAGATRFGFEGVAVTGRGQDETVWLAVQREWKDDPKGQAKILAYRPADKSWSAVMYPLDKGESGWVGLSEITAVGDDAFVVIERDNLVGDAAKIKKLTRVSVKGLKPAPVGGEAKAPVLEKTLVRDLLPDLRAPGGYVLDKVESFAIDANGDAVFITDNDGVDGSSGETQLVRLGKLPVR